MSKEEKESVIPDVIYDEKSGKSYLKGRFFGRGGFAKCYEIRESKTQAVFARKIVNKNMINKYCQREKMTQEIDINRCLNHVNVVGFIVIFLVFTIFILLLSCAERGTFETSIVDETYGRTKQVQYKTPTNISTSAITMISNTLQGNPSKRPSVAELLKDSFITTGFMPQSLSLRRTMAPRLDTLKTYNQRRSLSEINQNEEGVDSPLFGVPGCRARKQKPDGLADPQKTGRDIKRMLITLKDQVGAVLSSKPARQDASSAIEMTDLSAQPFLWVSKWVDYSHRYGFGYQLCDDGVGIMFNDGTRLIMLSNKYNIHYINREGREFSYTVKDYPQTLKRKIKLMNFFLRFMNEHLMKVGRSVVVKQRNCMSRISYMHQWSRTQTSLLMILTNGTVQINFIDHTKIIMCPLMASVTYVDQNDIFKTYRFSTIRRNGCISDLAMKLIYAFQELARVTQ